MPTANPEKGEFDVVIGGRGYVLVSEFNGLINLQKLLSNNGVRPSIDSIMERCMNGDLEALRGLFWSMLYRHHPEVTLEGAGDLIMEAGGLSSIDAMLAAVGKSSAPDPRDVAALGGAETNPPKAAKRRPRGIGARLN